MLDQVLNVFRIHPAYDLSLMIPGQSLSTIVSRCVDSLDKVFKELRPHVVLLQGDTSTTFAASLVAFYNRVPVGHVEAGLRTENRWQPFPEEINRRLTSIVADWHFAPTDCARRNLESEKINPQSILVTGNTVVDAFHRALRHSKPGLKLPRFLIGKRIVLVTAHRRENFGAPMRSICLALSELVTRFPDVGVVFPVHLNPMVRRVVLPLLSKNKRVWLTEPFDYFENVQMIQKATLIMTDSGGIQEEAPIVGRPVLILRKTTERPEGVQAGVARLVGIKESRIVREASKLLSDPNAYRHAASVTNPYGDGKASKRIVHFLLYAFGKSRSMPTPFVSERST
jgi:UDP-N-acetylglucosamine 2-epimerase (non-hydrolysing)